MSGKSVAERLQVKTGRCIAVVGASTAVEHAVGQAAQRAPYAAADIVVLCAADRAALTRDLVAVRDGIRADAILWVAYPKLTSALAGDLNRDVIHGLMPGFGLKTVSQIAIDADWSAMRMKRVQGHAPLAKA